MATVAIGAGKNAGLLAIQILAATNHELRTKIIDYKANMANESREKNNQNSEFTKVFSFDE